MTRLFVAALGSDFARLPRSVQALHDGPLPQHFVGRAHVRRGPSRVANWIADLAGFPPAGQDVPLRVDILPSDGGEVWQRDFDGHVTRSYLSTPGQRCVDERFGAVTLRLTLRVSGDGLGIGIGGARLFGRIPLPSFLWPISRSRESAGPDGAFRFDIAGGLPFLGEMIAYDGSLEPR